jgi:hypothetical protein
MTFSEVGVYMPIFLHAGAPVEGVEITNNGGTRPADSFYFDDSDPDLRRSVAPGQSATGVNGTGLMVGSGLSVHSGAGGEVAGCVWPQDQAVAIPGVVFAQERVLVMDGTTEPCP